MTSHQASEQMIGYLYQARYALYLLLNNDDEQSEISIEKFDDVSFGNGDTPEIMIQLKHHVKAYGDLNNASTDIWRTLKVWIDAISKHPDLLSKTKFMIITTASAPEGTAAYYLKTESQKRDSLLAYSILKKVAEESQNKGHQSYYKAFTSMPESQIQQLLDCIYVIDKSSNIVDVESDIKKGSVEDSLNYVDVKKDDIFFIPAGTVHAIGKGIQIAEIQQSSDITYRVFDYDRIDKNGSKRQLHIEKSLDVINFEFENKPLVEDVVENSEMFMKRGCLYAMKN